MKKASRCHPPLVGGTRNYFTTTSEFTTDDTELIFPINHSVKYIGVCHEDTAWIIKVHRSLHKTHKTPRTSHTYFK